MNYLLVALAFIIAFGAVYWIDRKNRAERAWAERIYRFIFTVFDDVHWGMPIELIMEKFKDKQFVTTEDFGKITGTGYLDQIEGKEEIFVSFFFPSEGDKELVRADFYLLSIPPQKYNLLFSHLNDKLSLPSIDQDNSPVWEFGNTVLKFEISEKREPQLQFWSKDFYVENSGETS